MATRNSCDRCRNPDPGPRSYLYVQAGELKRRLSELFLCRECVASMLSWLDAPDDPAAIEPRPMVVTHSA